MAQARLNSLEKKHQYLEESIRTESLYPARNDTAIRRLKEEKLLLKETIERLRSDRH